MNQAFADHTNFVTGQPYGGGNQDKLLEAGESFSSTQWATYKQWQTAGFQVQKGEHGVQLGRYLNGGCVAKHDADQSCAKCSQGGKRFFKVFNRQQVKPVEMEAEEVAA